VDDQLRSREHRIDLFSSGVRTFVCGLAKKLILANSAGAMWDALSESVVGNSPSVAGAWLGLLFYTFHIYFDFSGYSDMAIGLGKMFGFVFRENFNYPYIADSVTDFWRRWHISLSVWFREYVYIPLGGNRKGKGRMIFNLFAVWFLTGLWHGAGWNFILWGLYYGVLLCLEKIVLHKLLAKIPAWIRRIITFVIVMFGWLLFASDGMDFFSVYFSSMFTAPLISSTVIYDLVRSLVLIFVLFVASTPIPMKLTRALYEKSWGRWVIAVAAGFAIVLSVAYMVASSYNPFLYFRF
ncbi:MAG: MBOAT family protein, partial [Clostridia bacterium]|nr:MBOAT family protein [Clostridia bacterium]